MSIPLFCSCVKRKCSESKERWLKLTDGRKSVVKKVPPSPEGAGRERNKVALPLLSIEAGHERVPGEIEETNGHEAHGVEDDHGGASGSERDEANRGTVHSQPEKLMDVNPAWRPGEDLIGFE